MEFTIYWMRNIFLCSIVYTKLLISHVPSVCVRASCVCMQVVCVCTDVLSLVYSVAYVSRSGGMSNELNNIIVRNTNGVYEGVAIGGDRCDHKHSAVLLMLYMNCTGIQGHRFLITYSVTTTTQM